MFKNIWKRLGIQIFIYLVIFYLIPYVSIHFFSNGISEMITALFLVVFNLLIVIIYGAVDTYKYKLNWLFLFIPGLLFIPTVYLFYDMELFVYALLYSGGYGIGMLLGWSYRTYGYQLKPGYKKVYREEKEKERIKKEEDKKTKKKK